MTNYQYIARSAAGQEVTGVMQADSENAVVASLSERQLFPVRVEQRAAEAGPSGGKRVKTREVGIIYGQLADLLNSGVPLMRSLETLARAVRNPTLGEALRSVRNDVSEGASFAEAMEARPRVFPSLHASMIRAGEEGGFLEDVLSNLSEFLERQDELASKVKGSLIYPAILVTLGTIAILGILIFLVPIFRPMFEGVPLPLPSRMLFALSAALTTYWPFLLLALLLTTAVLIAASQSPAGKRTLAEARRRIPVFGPALKMVSLTRFCRTFGTLLHNGVPMLQSLAISKQAIGDPLLAQHIETAAESVRQGETLADPLGESGVFPPEILEMIAVAEQSNQLEKVLLQIADTVERRTSRQVDQAVRLIEPLILMIIAANIGFVAVGLLYPIFTMAQTLGR